MQIQHNIQGNLFLLLVDRWVVQDFCEDLTDPWAVVKDETPLTTGVSQVSHITIFHLNKIIQKNVQINNNKIWLVL